MKKIALFLLLTTALPLKAQSDCLSSPNVACLYELALKAASSEKETWALTGLYEVLLQTDPDLARRASWLQKYELLSEKGSVEGLKERLPAIKAEYYARQNKFKEAYDALGLLGDKPDDTAEPSLLIIDEARAGYVKDAFSRVAKMVEDEMHDETYAELLNIALEKDTSFASTIALKIKDIYVRRLADTVLIGAKGDLAALTKNQIEWAKTVKEGNEFPFDTKVNMMRATSDSYLLGTIFVNDIEGFTKGMAARGALTSMEDAESIGKLIRPLIRTNRVEWLKIIAKNVTLPADETVSAEEDVLRLKLLTKEQLLANLSAVEANPALKIPVLDQIIDILVQNGDLSSAVSLFIEKGRMDDLNKSKYEENRVSALFETLYRNAFAKKTPEMAILKAKATNEKALEFFKKIDGYAVNINEALKAPLTIEPAEEDWSIIMDLVILEGDLSKAAKVANVIASDGLKASAFTQIIRASFEKKT